MFTRIAIAAAWLLIGVSSVNQAVATDRLFPDLKAESPSKQYRVEAKSPDNKHPGTSFLDRPRWQSNFVYTSSDSKSGKVVWTRKQNEASPVAIHVSDEGWTVIFTAWDELVVVDPAGKDRGMLEILEEGFKDEASKSQIVHSSAGPIWTPYSLWCYFDLDATRYFSIRPWWGRRLFVDLEKGKFIDETKELLAASMAAEKKVVLARLAEAVETREEWEDSWQKPGFDEVIEFRSAIFVAGANRIEEAVPSLEKLQESMNIGKCSTGGMEDGLYYTFTMRQAAQLSLRRLGRKPKPLPANAFDDPNSPAQKKELLRFEEIAKHRAEKVAKIEKKMPLRAVLEWLGPPDFIFWNSWEYDIDAEEPYTLILKNEEDRVSDIEKKSPPLWKQSPERDRQMIF